MPKVSQRPCVTRRVGIKDSLASEYTYTLKILPGGIWRGIVETFVTHDLSGIKRSAAIITGLIMTAFGYSVGTLLAQRNHVERIAFYQ